MLVHPDDRQRLHLPLPHIHDDPDNVKSRVVRPDHPLTLSVREHGQVRDLLAWADPTLPPGDPPQVRLLDGHALKQALGHAGFTHCWVTVLPGKPTRAEQTLLEARLGTTAQNLTPIQLAAAAEVLKDGGLCRTDHEAAALLGKATPSWASKCKTIKAGLAPALHAPLEKGELKVTFAYLLAMLHNDHPRQEDLYARLKAEGWKRARLEIEVHRWLPGRKEKKAKAVKGKGKAITYSLTGTCEAAEAEVLKLCKAIQKAKSLGLSLAAVPELFASA